MDSAQSRHAFIASRLFLSTGVMCAHVCLCAPFSRLRGSPCSPQTDRKTDRRAECEEGKWSDRRTLTSSGQQPVSARKHMSPNHRRQRLKRPCCSLRLTWKISYRRSFGIDVTAHTCTKTNKSLGRIHI